jgi:SAM-dependent methyltransferase
MAVGTTAVGTTAGTDPAPTRWQHETGEAGSHAYVRRFADLAERGVDLDGEARFMDALLAPRSRVLDAGCGTARLGAELARRGHEVLAVDLDPVLLAAAPTHPRLRVQLADLTVLRLDKSFDAAVAAGNVMVYAAPGTEAAMLRRLHAHLVRMVRWSPVSRRTATTGSRTSTPTRRRPDSSGSSGSPPGTCGLGTPAPTSRSRCCAGARRLPRP